MKRNVSLEEISDGRLYDKNDMVRAGCGDCKGCSVCCHGMGESIILDPYDLWRLTVNLGVTANELLQEKLELHVVEGMILPNLRMNPTTSACGVLEKAGRGSSHAYRPGICRLFPLGRYYEDSTEAVSGVREAGYFRYFLQVHECPKPSKAKIKVYKWLDTDDIRTYEQFISDWHYFLKALQERIAGMEDQTQIRSICMYVLQQFYLAPCEDFYEAFHGRLDEAKRYFHM